jgi:eukaryotic-like serine/threonine-protein kinase
MKPIRRLIVEIHRRSLWQVLAIFVATGWAVLQVLDVLINRGIVPDWTFNAGLVLLLIGLPVVLATAFVQEGMGGFARQAVDLPPQQDPALPEPESATRELRMSPDERRQYIGGAHQRFFTWKNAILGGLVAFALLGFASAGYMGMRTFGIGAPGTLLAQGVIESGAAVVLADFESSGDAELGDVVTRTLRVDLLQSRVIRVLDRADVGPALQRMQLERDARITTDVATELSEREGYAAIITGNIASAGSGYVLTASVLGGEGFRQLAGFRETARSEAELVDAIERLSRSIRDKAGESLRALKGGPALAQVTTTSLDALRAYTRGLAAANVGDFSTALVELERAVELDPLFAMAYRQIGAMTNNIGGRQADVRRAATRAWELRDRLPEMERHITTAYYHLRVSGDLEAATRAYEQVLRFDSTLLGANARSAAGALGNNLMLLGRPAEAALIYRRILALRDAPAASRYNLFIADFSAGDTAWLASLAAAREALPEAAMVERGALMIAVSVGDRTAAEAALQRFEALSSSAPARAAAHRVNFMFHAQRGRLQAATRALDGLSAEEGRALRTYLELVRGNAARAVQQVRERHAGSEDDTVLQLMLEVALHAGDARLATAVHQRLESISPAADAGFQGQMTRQTYRGRLAALEGRYQEAEQLIESARRRCPGCGAFFHFDLATTHERAGDVPRAIAAYRAMLEQRDPARLAYTIEQPHALRRLAELYDAQGDRASATAYYAQFIELWRDADPELQPQVRAAQQRLAQLLPDR